MVPALVFAESPRYTLDPDAASTLFRLDAANTNNATVIKATPGEVDYIGICGGTATLHWVKFYDKATAPNCGTDVPVFVYSSGTTSTLCNSPDLPPHGIKFSTGIGICVVTGVADSDNTAATAHGAMLGVSYK